MSAPIEMRQVVVGGVRSPVLQAGPPEATEAVVFVHGNPGPAEDWRDLADKPRDFAYTVPARLRRAVGPDVGGRPSGRVRLGRAGQHRRAARLPLAPLREGVADAGTGRALSGDHDPSGLPDAHRPREPALVQTGADRLYDVSKSWPTKRAVLKLYRASPASAMGTLRDPLRALDRPALVVWGTGDAYIPWQQAERQRESFPSARIELLEGLGHWPFLEDPGAGQRAGDPVPTSGHRRLDVTTVGLIVSPPARPARSMV
jgi:pimeloyl-ACP methyl ester carboxylesterase